MDHKETVSAKVEEWLSWDEGADTRTEIATLRHAGSWEELARRLLTRLQFGTAGLRGPMGAGYAYMNDLVIVQTTQGLTTYLLETVERAAERGVVVGFDGRHHSERFAQLTAAILQQRGVRVWLFRRMCPTPWTAFGVKHLGAAAGIMVTASHNPKQDNGYKVYWGNGAQIISPHDSGIQAAIEAQLQPWPGSWDASVAAKTLDPEPELSAAYFSALSAAAPYPQSHAGSAVRFTVTAMHGVSHLYMVDAFRALDFQPFVPVREQMEPDPEFPTVPFPNPEENSALTISMAAADSGASTVILANDPDADRLAVAEKQPDGQWRTLTGNETGALLGWWCWHALRHRHPDTEPAKCHMIASTVSSKILRSIGEKEGFHFEETLTGFKWMANRAAQLEAAGNTVLFAFEEAIGFMCGTSVMDKDGVSAAMAMAQLATYLAGRGLKLTQQLDNIYETYGYHTNNNSYYICHQKSVIRAIFERIRNWGGVDGAYPSSLGGGRFVVSTVRDLTTGHDSSQPDGRAVLPVSASSQMVTLTFSTPPAVLTLRTSGTEPKIKWYSELCAPPGAADRIQLQRQLAQLVDAVVQELLQPEWNGLIERT